MYRESSLGRFTDVNPPRPQLSLEPNTEVSFIPMADVTNSGRWDNRQVRRFQDVSKGYVCFQNDDVLFAKITPCMENGKGCLVTGLENGVGFGSTEFHILRARGNGDSRFIYQWSIYEPLRLRAAASMAGSAGQQRVSASFLETFMIPAIEKREQTKIAEVLSTVDKAIEQTEGLIAKQKRIKTGLMQDLLTRGIDEHGNLRSEQTHQFKDSPLGRIPVEWKVKTIGELAVHVGSGITPRGGESVYTREGVLFIRSQNVHFGGLQLQDVSHIPQQIHDYMKRSEVFENDVLLNITGASIGRCCYMPAMNCSANVNQHVCAIRLDRATQSDAGFLTSVLESSIGQNQILQFNAGGNREGLNYQQVRSFVIPWPGRVERQQSYELIRQSSEGVKVYDRGLCKLRSLKTALMQDLLTGKVRVTPLLDDMEVTNE